MEDFSSEHAIVHWPFAAVALTLMLVGQVAKSALWTKQNAQARKPKWLWWWGYKTLPIHPVAVGAAIGAIWREPEPGIAGQAAVWYFALAGGFSVWLYQIAKGIAKRRGIELELPGESKPPPTAAPPGPSLDDETTPSERL